MIGQVVDGLEIVRALGTGGMGEVYLARDALGRELAVKVMRADREADRQAAGRFRREVLALGKLQHEAIVGIVDAGRLPSGALYLAMELVTGEDLQASVGHGGPLGVGAAIAVLARVASGLAYAHAHGVVHRDLKPGNVLLADGDPARAKIIDFGLAKIYANERLTQLTDEQQVLGSPLYWAPEQCSSSEVGPEADVYSLGALAYFALSGAPMFRPRPAVALVYAHQREVPEPLAARCEGIAIPPELARLVRACVEKAPAARPSAADLARELEALRARVPVEATAKRAPTVRPNDEAIATQARQIALELAAALGRGFEDIEHAEHELAELELELAVQGADASEDLVNAAGELRARVEAGYRALFADVRAARGRAPAEAAALYAELDALLGERGRA